jgi:hypothetical protein
MIDQATPKRARGVMSAVLASAAAAVLCFGMAAPAQAATGSAGDSSKSKQAEAVFEKVYYAEDPAATLSTLSTGDRALFDAWTSVGKVEVSKSVSPAPITNAAPSVSTDSVSLAAVAAAACSSYTYRGAFYNSLGGKLGDFWTTGQACRTGSTVSSVSFLDGGGKTSALGWRYDGRTTGKGISSNVGKVYGAYTFKLNIAGVDVQQPTYCARTVHTGGADFGDFVCGL